MTQDTSPDHIRNFSIIAHIDHGKSTLSDRLIQHCGALSEREMADQVLDSMDLERERGITIKAQCVTLDFEAANGESYLFNLIDTPGHVDFSYEVSRSLAACEGALLVVDAAQGVEAQSVANCYTAIENGLEVLPVLNKVDLPQAEPGRVAQGRSRTSSGWRRMSPCRSAPRPGRAYPRSSSSSWSAFPRPGRSRERRCKALIVDSWFDNYLGIVSLVRVVSGSVARGDRIVVKSTGKTHIVDEVGCFRPKRSATATCSAPGKWAMSSPASRKSGARRSGDTLVPANHPDTAALPGFAKVKPQVYAGLFPVNSDRFEDFRAALEKLTLNDASLFYEPESSDALGFGFRCGFLGLLHMEIVQQRLEREYDLDLITSAPTVIYEAELPDGSVVEVDNPSGIAGAIRRAAASPSRR